MDIQKLLSKTYSKKSVNTIVRYVGNDPKRFAALVNLFLTGPPRSAQQASWPLSYCVEAHPLLLRPHFRKILKAAAMPHAQDAVKRNVVRLLQFCTIPKRHQGLVYQLCFRFLENKKEAVAIRVFAMTVLTKLAIENPALRGEIIILIEDGLSYAKPAYLARAKKVLRQLHQLPEN